MPALAPPAAGAVPCAGSGRTVGLSPIRAGAHAAAAAPGSAGGPTPGSPGLAADPDLAYLSIADDRERAEREYLQQDSEHMAALEEAYARLREQNAAMEAQIKVGWPLRKLAACLSCRLPLVAAPTANGHGAGGVLRLGQPGMALGPLAAELGWLQRITGTLRAGCVLPLAAERNGSCE